jgi:hypothetical protein
VRPVPTGAHQATQILRRQPVRNVSSSHVPVPCGGE